MSKRNIFSLGMPDTLISIALASTSGILLLALLNQWPDTPDGLLHLQRIRALTANLQDGLLYPRWFSDFSFGYGYPVLNYYAPGFYYPPALLHWLGLDILQSTRLTLALCYALSAWWMYRLLRLHTSHWPAIVGTICFQCFPYRFYDLFLRGAFPEFIAFMWLPLIAYYTIQTVRATAEDTQHSPLAKASLCWAGLILTHNLTALMVALCYGLILILHIGKQWRTLLIPFTLGLTISAWYTVPALLEAKWVAIGNTPPTHGYLNHFIEWAHLLADNITYHYPSASQPTVPLPLYLLPLFLLTLVGIIVNKRHRFLMAGSLLLTLTAIWLTTDSSTWLWQGSDLLLGKLQFPWRWHTLIASGTGLLVALSLHAILSTKRTFFNTLISISLAGYFLIYGIGELDYPASNPEISTSAMWQWDLEQGQVGASWAGEFLPIWVTEQRWAIGREPSEPVSLEENEYRHCSELSSIENLPSAGSVEMLAFLSNRSSACFPYQTQNSFCGCVILEQHDTFTVTPISINPLGQTFRVDTEHPVTMLLNRFYFPSWQVQLEDAVVPSQPATELGLLSFQVPTGEHTISVQWVATQAVWLGRILAVVGWLILFILLRTSGPNHAYWLSSWLLVALCGLISTTGITARTQNVTAVNADFDTIRLEGSLSKSTKAGQLAPIHLIWTVTAPAEPLTTFIHVLDDTGAVVAQQDGPLSGLYMPHTRWRAGMVIHAAYQVPLPASIKPGQYMVKAGLYRPGASDQPLVPTGFTSSRIDIGKLEVRP